MYSKFKRGTIVLVNGEGKEEPLKLYKKRYGKVIDKDAFFLDYQVQFKDGTTDWLDAKCLIHSEKYNERSKSK